MCANACAFSNRVFGLTRTMAGRGTRATRTKAQLTNVVTEYHSKQPYIQHGGILLSAVAFIPFQGQCKERFFAFFFCFFFSFFNKRHYCKSTRLRIGKFRRQIKKKGMQVLFTSPSSSPISFSLLLICVGEPMVHYNWPLSSCR